MTANIPGAPANFSGTNSYAHDAKLQLTQETSTRAGGYTNNQVYDGAGNVTSFKVVAQGFNSNNQNTANTYDLNGNPTTYKGVLMSYDVENRLASSGTTLTAGYNGDDLRAWKQTSAGRTYYLFDGENPIIEMDSTGAVTAVNTHGANGLVSRHTSAGSTLYAFDRQGNVAQRWSGGTLVASDGYEAFGTGVSTATRTDPFGYGVKWGYYTDLETGLCLLTHRYYDPGAGRFLTRDPSSYDGGVNLYNFCWNNSMLNQDPSGLDPIIRGCSKGDAEAIRRAWRDVCSKVKTMNIDPKLKECLEQKCKSKYNIRCAKAGDPGCEEACAYTGDLGDPYGKPSDHTVICPGAIPLCDGDNLCETLVHELVHACGELGFPNGNPPEYPVPDDPIEQYCDYVGGGPFPPGSPCGKGPTIAPK